MTEQFDIRELFTTESLESVEGVETLIDVERCIACLPMREKKIVYLFCCGHTQTEIGAMMGLSQSQVSRVLAKMHKKHSETA